MKIPKGWRRLKKGTQIRYGDKFWMDRWALTGGPSNGFVGDTRYEEPLVYIRRIKN